MTFRHLDREPRAAKRSVVHFGDVVAFFDNGTCYHGTVVPNSGLDDTVLVDTISSGQIRTLVHNLLVTDCPHEGVMW